MRRLFLAAALLMPAVSLGFANSAQDRVGVGTDIVIADGETAGDIACAFCTVRVHGDVRGDIATFLGTVTVDADRNIAGDVAIAAGETKMATGAAIRGEETVLPGRIWLLLPFAPLLILAGVIWLVVYVIRRNRYQFPAYPGGRGF